MISCPTFQPPPNILKEGEGEVMGMNRGKEGGESLVELEREREDENCRHIIKNSRLKLNITSFCKENLKIFIASTYMNSRKVLKERMRTVCCLYMMVKMDIQRRRLCRKWRSPLDGGRRVLGHAHGV